MVNTLNFIMSPLQQEIFSLLCRKVGSKLTQREIAKELKVSPAGVKKALEVLKTIKIVNIEKQGNMNLTFVELNRTKETILLKKFENIKSLYKIKLVEKLEYEFPASTIILFGSYGRGEDTITSDIDIAIIDSKDKKIALNSEEKILSREIRINHYKSLQNLNEELKESLLNGIILSGVIEL